MIPFSNGSEFADWQINNCYQCRKYKENVNVTCKYEREICMAYLNTGQITDKAAKIMGLDGSSPVCTIRIHKSIRNKPKQLKHRWFKTQPLLLKDKL